MILSEAPTTNYAPPAPGTFTARLVALIDLGTQQSTYEGEAKSAKKILFKFEILDDENRRDDGSPHTLSKRFTASLHERAALRKFLEAWRGKPFSPDELRGFDLKNLLGQPCLLGIVNTEKEARTYANLSSCMKLPKGMAAPAATEALALWDMTAQEPDWGVFAGLHRKLQEQIEAAPEFARLTPPKAVPAAAAAPARGAAPATTPPPPQPAPAAAAGAGFDDIDQDIPF